MTTALWRVRADNQVRLARGPAEHGPVELLDALLTVSSLLADPADPLRHLESMPAAGAVPAGATVLVPLDGQPVWAPG
jgi:hypothetical protein